MKNSIDLRLTPEIAYNETALNTYLNGLPHLKGKAYRISRRSIDARKPKVFINLRIELLSEGNTLDLIDYQKPSSLSKPKHKAIVAGSGPAGLFAALRLIELGIKPIVFERGKDVRSRRRDIAAINKKHEVNPNSNYCFGEGGAGTYSDGKLYTRSKKRGDIIRILEILVAHGAREDILYDAYPHIGTNKLPNIVAELTNTIIREGGEVLFEHTVTDVLLEENEIKGVVLDSGNEHYADAVILATGHSARDIFHLLNRRGIQIESKPFALGVRVEHSQNLIDRIQYKCKTDRGEYLPAASYSLVNQAIHEGEKRGVFSFCMCPGGFIVPSATAEGEVVVNGMSPSRRDSRFSNSGIVVSVEQNDFDRFSEHGALAGLYFQEEIEKKACMLAGGDQTAPAQRLVDFVKGRLSNDLPETSYQPGIKSVLMDEVLPPFISERLKRGFKAFGKTMKGYYTNEAQIVGVESRTSSPVRIPRNPDTLEHVNTRRLFPCGEGAGYAGGIVSAAMDGERCAEAVSKIIKSN